MKSCPPLARPPFYNKKKPYKRGVLSRREQLLVVFFYFSPPLIRPSEATPLIRPDFRSTMIVATKLSPSRESMSDN